MSDFLGSMVDIVWGMPLVILLVGGGLFLSGYSGLTPLRGFTHAFKLLSGAFHHPGDAADRGQISHLGALSNALSATIGIGNIAGVAIALQQGGLGSIFWMWVVALVGMNTKFFECTLSLLYRGEDFRGQVQGGPMYVISEALPRLKPMAYVFALCGMVGTLSLFNANQLTQFMASEYQWNHRLTGLVLACLVALILSGGVRRIAATTNKLVPAMCILYILGCLGVWWQHGARIPQVLAHIFLDAFSGGALLGAGSGLGVMAVMKIGVKRAAFSNEAGIGTAPMAHGNARTSEPVAEGLVAMVGPFIDTLVVCTLTAVTIALAVPDFAQVELDGVLLTKRAFALSYPQGGVHVLGLIVFLFSFTTMIGLANYNKKCWDFLFKGWGPFRHRWLFVLFYMSTIFMGAIFEPVDMINLMDISFALMAMPNVVATLLLAPQVKRATTLYFERYLSKEGR